MFGEQLAKLLDLVGDHGLDGDDIAFAEEWRQCFASFAMNLKTGGSAYATRNAQ